MQNSADQILQLLSENDALVVQQPAWRQQLEAHINELILHDFHQLVSLLYRVDVNEQKLRSTLQKFPQTDAASVIADLLLSRQAEKIKARSNSKPRANDLTDEEERW